MASLLLLLGLLRIVGIYSSSSSSMLSSSGSSIANTTSNSSMQDGSRLSILRTLTAGMPLTRQVSLVWLMVQVLLAGPAATAAG
jgi:hypothetical protein